MRVELIRLVQDKVERLSLELPAGATAAAALEQAGWSIDEGANLSVFCHKIAPETTLNDSDRLEITPPLLIDPKQVRRIRAEKTAERRQTRKKTPRSPLAAHE